MIFLTVQNLGSAMADVVVDAMIAEAVRSERYVLMFVPFLLNFHQLLSNIMATVKEQSKGHEEHEFGTHEKYPTYLFSIHLICNAYGRDMHINAYVHMYYKYLLT